MFLFFLQNYSSETLLTLDAPTWTLAVQAAFYLVFPLFLVFGSRMGRRAWIFPLLLVAFGAVFNWVSFRNGWGPMARLSLFAMLPYLALGMAIAHLPPLEDAARGDVDDPLVGAVLARVELGLARDGRAATGRSACSATRPARSVTR